MPLTTSSPKPQHKYMHGAMTIAINDGRCHNQLKSQRQEQSQQLLQTSQQDTELQKLTTSSKSSPQQQQPQHLQNSEQYQEQKYQQQQPHQLQQERYKLKIYNTVMADHMSTDILGTASIIHTESMNVSELQQQQLLQTEPSIKYRNMDSQNLLKQKYTHHQITELSVNLQSNHPMQHKKQQQKRTPLQKVLLASKTNQQQRNDANAIHSNPTYNLRQKLGDHFNNVKDTNYYNESCDGDNINESKLHNMRNIGEPDSIGSESDVGSVGALGACSIDANILSESFTTTAAAPHTGSMVSITSEQQLCQQYNSHQHSDYIISDYMEKIATRISLLETELKFAWRALDLLSGEYGKIWGRLEKLEKISFEQQSVVSNLMGLIALKQEQQQQQPTQNQQHIFECETHLDFIDTEAVTEQQRSPFDCLLRDEQLLLSNLVEAEQQAILLNNSAAALLQDIGMEGTSKQYSNLLQELKNDTIDALDAVRMDSELDALDKLLQQQKSVTYGEDATNAFGGHFDHLQRSGHYEVGSDDVNATFSQLDHDGELKASFSTLNNLEKRKQQPVAAAITGAHSDSDVILYGQQSMQANDARGELQQFLNSHQILDKLTSGTVVDVRNDPLQWYKSSGAAGLLQTTSGSMQSLPFLYGKIFDSTRKSRDNSLNKAQSFALIGPQIFRTLPSESTSNLHENSEDCMFASNVNNIDMPLSNFVEQIKFFRQAASKQGEGGLLDVPIEDTGGTSDRASHNIDNASEMNEEFYKKLNEAYRDNSLTTEISNVEQFLQQSEATHEHVLGGLGTRTNSALDMIREDNEEASEVTSDGVVGLVNSVASGASKIITITTTNIATKTTTTPSSFVAKKAKESKKQKKKKASQR